MAAAYLVAAMMVFSLYYLGLSASVGYFTGPAEEPVRLCGGRSCQGGCCVDGVCVEAGQACGSGADLHCRICDRGLCVASPDGLFCDPADDGNECRVCARSRCVDNPVCKA